MKFNIDYRWIIAILLLLSLGTVIVIWQVQRASWMKQNYQMRVTLDACIKAPKTIYDSLVHDTIFSDRWHTPKESSKPDTVWDTLPARLCEKYYADLYPFSKGTLSGIIHYAVAVKDCQVKILFPQIDLPIDYQIETKTVDTCIAKDPQYKAKNHWMIDLDCQWNTKQFVGVQAGISYSIKDRVKINLGGGHDFPVNLWYVKTGVGIYLR
jgi:hypothetical protein